MPSKRKKMRQDKRKKRGGERVKSKSRDWCVTFKPKNSKFCFLRVPELRKLIFCIWFRRPRSLRPVCDLTRGDEWTRQQGWPVTSVTSSVKFQRTTGPILFVMSPSVEKLSPLRASLHWGVGPQVGEVTRLGGVTCLPYDLSYSYPTYHANVKKWKRDIIWTGGLPQQSG